MAQGWVAFGNHRRLEERSARGSHPQPVDKLLQADAPRARDGSATPVVRPHGRTALLPLAGGRGTHAYSLTHSLTYLLTHSLTHSLIRPCTLTHSLTLTYTHAHAPITSKTRVPHGV